MACRPPARQPRPTPGSSVADAELHAEETQYPRLEDVGIVAAGEGCPGPCEECRRQAVATQFDDCVEEIGLDLGMGLQAGQVRWNSSWKP